MYSDNKQDEVVISFPITEGNMAVDSRDGCFVDEEEREKIPCDCLISPYAIDVSHAKQFVNFLRGCGGFEVW